MQRFALLAALAIVAPVYGQLTAPLPGWQATLQTRFHGVEGVVSVVDENTLRIDDFSYDGQGLDVYFYLGAENSTAAFSAGLSIGPQLVGDPFDGSQLVIDLPAGQTIAGWNAISVWCVDVDVSFGDAVFEPTLPGDYNGDGLVDAADYTVWRDQDGLGLSGAAADGDGSGAVDAEDYTLWRTAYGSAAPSAAPAPEPTGLLLAALAALAAFKRAY